MNPESFIQVLYDLGVKAVIVMLYGEEMHLTATPVLYFFTRGIVFEMHVRENIFKNETEKLDRWNHNR